jgi:hypothetical protein
LSAAIRFFPPFDTSGVGFDRRRTMGNLDA